MKTFILSVASVFLTTISFSQLSMIETHQNPSCNGNCDGIIAITPNNMVGSVSYTWLPTGANNSVNSNLCAGTYTILAEDGASNTASLSVTLTQPTPLMATTSQNNVTCANWCNGSAIVNPSGGTPPYNYVWQNGVITPQVTNLCPGVIPVTVTDSQGCTVTQTVSLVPPTPVSLNMTVTNSSCASLCNGSATTSPTGGIAPYTYQWFFAGGLNFTIPVIQNVCATSGSLIVTDANGCVTSTAVTIGMTLNNLPNASITSTSYNETCYLSGDGSIDINITGSNTGPFTYTWSNGATTQDITNIPSGIYWVSITDGSSNCTTMRDTITSTGINCGTITGNVYADNNSDCMNNTGDVGFNHAAIFINPGNRYGYTNPNGDYVINNLPYGTYSVSINNLIGSCTQTITTNVNAGTPNSINNDLAVSINYTVQPDMMVSGFGSGIVPGFAGNLVYYLNNLNMNNASGLFKVTLPSACIPNILTVSPSVYTISGDTIIWNFSNITYGNQQQFYVYFNVPVSTPLGSLFQSCGYVQPTLLDVNPNNNTFCYQRIVTGSFDPNDKSVSPVGNGPTGEIPIYTNDLTYLIRFQNTGNGPAVNIVVKDTLSPYLDINTLEMLGSSHNYDLDILPGNILRWKFNNIMLVDSGTNEPASHGFIQYRVKFINSIFGGAEIKNTAYIYFDFNAPVVTNTALNTIEIITNLKNSAAGDNDWNIYPNPSNGTLYLSSQSGIKEQSLLTIINSIGQTVHEESLNSNYKTLDLSKLNNGVYFVKVTSDLKSTVKRIVLNK